MRLIDGGQWRQAEASGFRGDSKIAVAISVNEWCSVPP